MKDSARPEEELASLWEYVPVNDFRIPPNTVAETVKESITSLWRRFRPTATDETEPFPNQFETLSEQELAHLVPSPEWHTAAEALRRWLEKRITWRTTVTVTGPPCSGNAEILEHFAAEQKWRVIPAPDAERILTGDPSWLAQFLEDKNPWVLPRLEKCYLRHVSGLKLVRELFQVLQAERIGPGIIGCDSWARAYLQYALPGLLQDAYVAQALDYERLGRWLQALATGTGGKPPLFRQQGSGVCLLPVTADPEGDNGLFLQHLAAYSRGNPGVARALWCRALLNLRQDADTASKDTSLPPSPASLPTSRPKGPRSRTIWVLPWKRLQHPAVETVLKDEPCLVLHTLLLHNGLSAEILSRLLPFSEIAVSEAVSYLEQLDLIQLTQGVWRVSSAGYPEAKKLISDAGYLTDDF